MTRSKKIFVAVKLFLLLKSVKIMCIYRAVMISEVIMEEKNFGIAEIDLDFCWGHKSQ